MSPDQYWSRDFRERRRITSDNESMLFAEMTLSQSMLNMGIKDTTGCHTFYNSYSFTMFSYREFLMVQQRLRDQYTKH